MSKITGADKQTGQQMTATEYNAFKASINALYDALFSNGLISNGIQLSALPNAKLSPDQFETLQNGFIGLIGYGQGGGGTTPTAPIITVDAENRKLSATHGTFPNALEYRENGGAWQNYTSGAFITFDASAVLANYYQFRVKADSGTDRNPGTIAGNPYIAAAGGDVNLLFPYAYLDLSALTGTGFPTPPLGVTNNNWKITGDGYGQGQPKRRLVVGSHVAFQYQSGSASTKMCICYVAGSLGNYKAFEIVVNDAGVVSVENSRQSVNEVLTTQPTAGQFVDLTRVSETGSVSVFKVSILTFDGTVIFSKDYTVNNTPSADCAVEFDTAGGGAIVYKPQGYNLTVIA